MSPTSTRRSAFCQCPRPRWRVRRGCRSVRLTVLVLILVPLLAASLPAQANRGMRRPIELSLSEALSRAIADNLDLRLARVDTGIARAQLIGSRLRPNPALAVQYQTTGERSPAGLEGEGSVSITQDLQLWGVRSARIRAAALEQERAIYSILDAERLVRREVASSYRELLFDQLRVGILDSVSRLNGRIARAAQLAFEQGVGSELDQRLSAAATQQSLLDRDRASREYHIEQLEFARLIGDTLTSDYRLTDSLPPAALPFLVVNASRSNAPAARVAFAVSESAIDSLVRVALSARPDVRAAGYAVQVSTASVALARIAGRPGVALGGLLSRSRDNFALGAQQGSSVNRAIGLGVVIGLPLANRNQGEIARSEFTAAATALRLSNVRRLVERDVRVAAERVALAATQLETLRRSIVPANTDAIRIAELAFSRGQASIFQVLQVQRAYVESSTGLLESMRLFAAALADLEAAVGQHVQ